MISRIVLVVLTLVFFMILMREAFWLRIKLPLVMAVLVFLVSFPSTVISRFFIRWGDKIENKVLRVLYYALALPVMTLGVMACAFALMYFSLHDLSISDENAYLGPSLMVLALMVPVVEVLLVLPYLQTLIVLVARKILKEES